MSTVAATVAIKKPALKSKLFHASLNNRCMCSWKKLETWPAIKVTYMELPRCEYLWQKVAQHADSNDVWLGLPCRFLANGADKMVVLRMSIQQHALNLKTKEIIQTSSSRDITSLECCWNAKQRGKSRPALLP
jgi:hypothetical protein